MYKNSFSTYNVGLPLDFFMTLYITSLRMIPDMAKYVNKYSSIKSSIFQLQDATGSAYLETYQIDANRRIDKKLNTVYCKENARYHENLSK